MSDVDALIEGFARYKAAYQNNPERHQRLISQQRQPPRVMMVACCDSRVDPAIITDSRAGDIFVLRNIANLVPPMSEQHRYAETSAAIEFGVCYLEVETLIVMGHSRCGGIGTLVNRLIDESLPSHPLEEWTAIAEPVATEVLRDHPQMPLDQKICACSRAALSVSLTNLLTYPWVAEREARGSLSLRGWYFNLATAELEELDPATGEFSLLC
ncbi:MAG: carbonic anhydrase [Pseudomonadota bacterium]|nr:carbonic anhydrase [Pseudomonadota bacterium]